MIEGSSVVTDSGSGITCEGVPCKRYPSSKFVRKVSKATGHRSFAKTGRKPSSWKPQENPPAPQKSSPDVNPAAACDVGCQAPFRPGRCRAEVPLLTSPILFIRYTI